MLIGPAAAETISGRARVVDGDTLSIGDERVRLFGIDAPEHDQTCDRGGQVWACGQVAAETLAEIVGRARLTCAVQQRDRYGRAVAICAAGGTDLAEVLVARGAATAYRRYSSRYVAAETRARTKGAGIWSGQMVVPEAYRHRADAEEPVSGCAIKGNIGASGKHIYHLPGQADYAATRINTGKGEQWFCSEAEARAAGFRRAAR